ncbi:MAG: sulfatase family protein [Promethearchaeota archaeon]
MAYNAPFIVNKVLNFLYQGKKPLFIWMHFMDTHSPYNPPSKYVLKFREKDFTLSERKFLNQHVYSNDKSVKITQNLIEDLKILYDAQISFIDDCLKDLFVHIERHYQENCLIIITSDHGESFYEHGIFGHQGSVFDELLKIPLFIREMGKKLIKREVKEPVQLLDIAPTILDFYGLDPPEDFQGKSLLHLIQGKKLNRKKPIITECYQKGGFMKRNNKEGFKLISIRTNDWKYIYDEEKNQEYLFNLKNDPLERVNLINKNLEKTEDFRLIRDFHLQKAKETQERSRIVSAIDNLNLKK